MDQDLKDGSLEMDRDLNEFSGSGSNVEGRLRNTNNGGNLKNQTNATNVTLPLLRQAI